MTAEQWPDGPNPVDEAFTQLNDPRYLLAEALATVRAAQVLGRQMDVGPGPEDENGERPAAHFDRIGRHQRLVDEARMLTQIAKVAVEAAGANVDWQRFADTGPDGYDEADMELRTVPPADLIRGEGPRAVNGVRFEATVPGRHLGTVGFRDWLWNERFGYLDVTEADQISHPDAAGFTTATFSGIVKSVAGDWALCVNDAGTSVTLPRALLTESPDE